MKRLAVELNNDQTIIHEGDDIYKLKNDEGFIVVRDMKRPLGGGRCDTYLATYNPAFIVRMWDADHE